MRKGVQTNVNFYIIAVLIIASHVMGQFTLSDVTGTWSNAVGGSGINYPTVGDENQVRWGDPAGSTQSGLGFTGSAPPDIVLNLVETFEIGTLRHFRIGLGN